MRSNYVLSLALAVLMAGCAQKIPKEALELTHETLGDRQRQTRRFVTKDEKLVLSSSVAVLQDLGFTLESSATELGLVVAAKDLSAIEPGQVALAVLLFAATAVGGAPIVMPVDSKQKVRVSLTTRISGGNNADTVVRVTFQRIVWNNRGEVTKTEPLNDDKLYREFFEKLSKAVFLDAHEL